MNPTLFGTAVLAVAVAATGCCKQGKDDSAPPPKPAPDNPVAPTVTVQRPPALLTADPAAPAATPTPALGGGSGAYAPDGLPADIPASRSKVPTIEEWNGVPREINCPRSTPLNCETKMLREWLRVSCRPKSTTGGTPTNVNHKTGPTQETYLFAKGGVASLVTPVTRGKHYEATFAWTDKTQTLVVDWPQGAPRPSIKFTD
jgi:hypothetical protein